MSLRSWFLILAAAVALAAQTTDADVMLQRAIRKESVEGDLKGAIDLYKKVVAAAGKNRAAAAKALLRLGQCYEKQGNTEAQLAYERLVREFSDQKQQARDAEARLSAMGQTAGGKRSMTAQLIAKGSNLSLGGRVTPDGKLFPYVDRDTGDIAVRDLRTGAVRRLTNEGTWKQSGEIGADTLIPSRDSRQIVYGWYVAHSQLELRVINADGTGMGTIPIKVNSSDHYDPEDWSPDGQNILVSGWARDWCGIAMIDLKTGELHRLRDCNLGFEVAGFSRDGRWIVYSMKVAQDSTDWDIFALDTKTRRENVVVSGAGADRHPVWVPDSDKILFQSDRNGANAIWMVRFQDGQAAGAPVLINPDAGDYIPKGVSRDGSLYYGRRHAATDVYQATVDPRTMRVQDPPVRVLETYIGHNSRPVWSPGGDLFAYYSERDKTSRLVVHQRGGKETVLAEPARWTVGLHWCGGDNHLTSWGMPQSWQLQMFDARTGAASSPAQPINGLHAPYQVGFSPDCSAAYVSTYSYETGRRRIYRYEIATGKETEVLTDTGEWATCPRVSPDGRWLALNGKLEGGTQSGILLVSTSGGPLRMIDSKARWGHIWSPDSTRLMYTRKAEGPATQGVENELYWVPAEGGAPQPMGIRMPYAGAPSLNSDGRRIIFSASAEVSNELWVLRNLPLNQRTDEQVRKAAPIEQLVTKGRTDTFTGRVTPDGQLLPFVDHETGDIALRDLRTGESRHVTNEGGKWRWLEFGGDSPIPSRDGKQLVYAWYAGDHAAELRVVNIDGTGRRTVPMRRQASIVPADWSPDGKSVVALLQESNPGTATIATVDLVTGEQQQLLSCGDPFSVGYKCRGLHIAGFSPDGQWIVYKRQVDEDRNLFALDRRSVEETLLVAKAAWNADPLWVPGTDKILFRSARSGRSGVWMIRFQNGWAGGAPVLVKHDAADPGRLQGLSRDGSLFYGTAHWVHYLYEAVFDPQTSHIRGAPTRVLDKDQPDSWFPSWSPDGKSWAYFRIRDRSKPNQPAAGSLVIRKGDGTETVVAEHVAAPELPGWCRADGRTFVYAKTEPPFQRFDAQTGAVVPPGTQLLNRKPSAFPWGFAFSPDCQSVYIVTNTSNQRRITKVDVASGSETLLLADTGRCATAAPSVSPDGRWLAFRGDLPGKRPGILALPTGGGPPRMLFEAAGDDLRNRAGIGWMPDSRRALFQAYNWPRPLELYSAPVEGGAAQPTGVRLYGAVGVSIHPDGQRILFSAADPVEDIWALRNRPLN